MSTFNLTDIPINYWQVRKLETRFLGFKRTKVMIKKGISLKKSIKKKQLLQEIVIAKDAAKY